MINTKQDLWNKFLELKALVMAVVMLFSTVSWPVVRAEETPVASPQTDYYGAIAYSPSTRRFGSSWSNLSRAEAETRALASCNRSDCRILLSFANSCGALAVARNGGYSWDSGSSLYEAKLYTSNRCTRKFGGCKLICSVCSRGNEP